MSRYAHVRGGDRGRWRKIKAQGTRAWEGLLFYKGRVRKALCEQTPKGGAGARPVVPEGGAKGLDRSMIGASRGTRPGAGAGVRERG